MPCRQKIEPQSRELALGRTWTTITEVVLLGAIRKFVDIIRTNSSIEIGKQKENAIHAWILMN